jgi:alpha-1,2-glucosyltransferase
VAATCLICLVSYGILRLLRTPRPRAAPVSVKGQDNALGLRDSTVLLDANTALNVALFPPLFFFSALFYTDVMSTLVVLLSYGALLGRRTAVGPSSGNFMAVLIGVVALAFRQTNIFWVAVFPAGLAVINALKAASPPPTRTTPTNVSDILRKSWDDGVVHDCAVQDAGLQGMKTGCSRTWFVLTRPRLYPLTTYSCDCSHKKPSSSVTNRSSLYCSSRVVRRFRGLEW